MGIDEQKYITHILQPIQEDNEHMLDDMRYATFSLIALLSAPLADNNNAQQSENSENARTLLSAAKNWNPYRNVNTLDGIRRSKIANLCAILCDLDGLETGIEKINKIDPQRVREQICHLLKETRETLIEIVIGIPSYYYSMSANETENKSGWIIQWNQESNIKPLVRTVNAKQSGIAIRQGVEQIKEAALPLEELNDQQSAIRNVVHEYISVHKKTIKQGNEQNAIESSAIESKIDMLSFDRWKNANEADLYKIYYEYILTGTTPVSLEAHSKIVSLVNNARTTWESSVPAEYNTSGQENLEKTLRYIHDISALGWATTIDIDCCIDLLRRISRWE